MKTISKILAGLTALCLLCGAVYIPAAATSADTALRYNDDGKFRILCFTDTHQKQEDQPKMIAFLGEAIDFVQPDLVLFLGDNVYGDACESAETELAAITKILSPVVERGVPFAFVWGNHDPEYHPGGEDGRPAMMEMYQSFAGCLARADDPAASGASSFHLPIYGSKDSAEIVSNLWFFDSSKGTVSQSQLDWYKAASLALQEQNGGKPVPSLAFSHIIVPEIYSTFPEFPFDIPPLTEELQGARRLRIPDFTKTPGFFMEKPMTTAGGELDAWAGRGDIFAAFFGHDHVNNFKASLRGIDIVQIPGTTWDGSYGSDIFRGATLITLDESKPGSYSTQLIPYSKLAFLPGSKIGWPFRIQEFYYWICFGIEAALQAVLVPVTLIRRIVN